MGGHGSRVIRIYSDGINNQGTTAASGPTDQRGRPLCSFLPHGSSVPSDGPLLSGNNMRLLSFDKCSARMCVKIFFVGCV
ncbi:unnamed protein product [Cylicocyclus nassatus]|uniref:Uncharacterized protein n=1 Tax=Cylicocyclus nassatus TaxID=53992 RepID=A0AA36HEK3_CYLNA|nr:unnamed protein product [Cylicocyclus nassatus]